MPTPAISNTTGSQSRVALAALIATLLAPLLWWSASSAPALAATDDPENGVRPAASSQPQESNPRPEPVDYCTERFLEPLERLGAHLPRVVSGVTWAERLAAATVRLRAALGAADRLDAWVATVPDPIDSGMDYAFDSILQSIYLGVETRLDRKDDPTASEPSFYRDRSFLPWVGDGETAEDRAKTEACRKSTPGIVTFRSGSAEEPRLVVVLLVGETPTSGAHPKALSNALEAADVFTKPDTVRKREPLRLLGPSFSGSAFSIRRGLQQWRESSLSSGIEEVRIVTGSGTGGALRGTLSSPPEGGWFSKGRVRFSATIVPEAQLECRYLWFLHSGMGEEFSNDGGREERTLGDVALLHESGTEFGNTLQSKVPGAPAPCRLRVGVDLTFPAHISALRDAYEELDRKAHTVRPEVARSTALEISLRDKHAPRGMEAEPSSKTTYARDVSVSRILGAIGSSTIRHVIIQATDVADAIFLSRKIRDVAPDVRLAFSKADVLLLHPSFQRDLFGSLVITPYPFLGSSDFVSAGSSELRATSASKHREGFENDSSEGIFNAVLALRGADVTELHEYTPLRKTQKDYEPVLPVWITAIGHDAFVPLLAAPNQGGGDRNTNVVFRGWAEPALAPPASKGRTWKDEWTEIRSARLYIGENVVLSRLWRFIILSLFIAFCIDRVIQKRTVLSLSNSRVPETVSAETDSDLDRSIVRTKWKVYAAIRTYVLASGLMYMVALWVLAAFVHRDPYRYFLSAFALALVGFLAFFCLRTTLEFAGDYFRFAESSRCKTPWLVIRQLWRKRATEPSKAVEPPPGSFKFSEDDPPNWWDKWTLWVGIAHADANISPAKLSFAQLRLLANLALVIAISFLACQTLAVYWGVQLPTGSVAQLPLTLLIARALDLFGGLSPAVPTLLCLGVVYVWAVGRMARLRVVHSLSQLSPKDEVPDLVSTPIRLILYPEFPGASKDGVKERDDSFTRVERRSVNSIVRPITGPAASIGMAIVLVVQVGLFRLNPLSTLEIRWGTGLLYLGLFLCSSLIGNTIIQLLQYWGALHLLLKVVFQHRLGRSFTRVAPFVREPLHDQVSRTPHDVLRLAACASQFDDLVRTARHLPRFELVGHPSRQALQRAQTDLRTARSEAIALSNSRNIAGATRAEEQLGRHLIESARTLMKLLHLAWDGKLPRGGAELSSSPVAEEGAPGSSGPTTRRAEGAPDPHVPRLPAPPHDFSGGVGPSAAVAVAPVPTASPGYRPWAPARAESVAHPTPSRTVVPNFAHHREPNDEEAPSEALAPEAWQYGRNESRWVKNAESFAATLVALLINRHVRQLDYFVYTLLGSGLLLMFAALTYPFEPHRILLTWIWLLVLVAGGSGLWIYVELDRNALLSRIARTSPGVLTFNRQFALRVLTWAVVPLTAAAATQYPGLANGIVRFFAPFIGSN